MVEVFPRGSRVPDLVELGKPRIVLMVLLTVAAGFWMAGPSNHAALVLFHTLLGTAFVAAGTNALNQVLERRFDALMLRTRSRPLPAGRRIPHRQLEKTPGRLCLQESLPGAGQRGRLHRRI